MIVSTLGPGGCEERAPVSTLGPGGREERVSPCLHWVQGDVKRGHLRVYTGSRGREERV